MESSPIVYAVILAGGSSTRMNGTIPKQRRLLQGKSVLLRSVEAFEKVKKISGIVVVCRKEDLDFAKNECKNIQKTTIFVIGSDSRFGSAQNGFAVLPKGVNFVAIHDAARCLVTPLAIEKCLDTAIKNGCCSLVGEVFDTVKEAMDGKLLKTLNRDELKMAQTPQIFRTDWYQEAMEFANRNGLSVTDDNMLLEAIGKKVSYVVNSEWNPKITTENDLILANAVLKVRQEHE